MDKENAPPQKTSRQRKQVEKTPRENKATIQALIDATPETAMLVDTNGTVLAINEIAAQRFGKSKEGMIGRIVYDFMPAAIAKKRAGKLAEVHVSGKPVCFADVRSGRDYYNNFYPVLDSKGNVEKIAIFAQDLTMQHQTELALRESEEKYRQLFENESDAVMIFDAETGRFEDANRATLHLYGYSKAEFLMLTVEDISAEKEKTKIAIQQVVHNQSGRHQVPLRYFIKKDGTIFPGEKYTGTFISNGRKKIIGAVRDISERIAVQEALKISEQRYRNIFENAPIGFYRTTPDGRILDANPALLIILGYSSFEQLASINLETADYHPDYPRRLFRERLERDSEIKGMESFWRRPDDRLIYIRENTQAVRDADGVVVCYEGTIEDITESKQAEKQIHTLSQQLIRAQEAERQRISRELHDRVAQDLSTLKIGFDTLFDYQEAVRGGISQKIGKLSEMLQKTISAVRDLSYALQPPGLDHMGLVSVLETYCEEFSEQSGLKVDLHCAGMKKLQLHSESEINVYRLIQEGLNNVKKHAGASRVTVKLLGASSNIILRIEDDGVGFDMEKRAFAAAREKRMGLLSMEERVGLLQGRMTIWSQPQKGTRIFIKFPYQEKTDG